MAQPAEMGALPQLFAATSPSVRGGDHIGPDGFAESRGYPRWSTPTNVQDVVDAARLWAESVRLVTGVDYAELDDLIPPARTGS